MRNLGVISREELEDCEGRKWAEGYQLIVIDSFMPERFHFALDWLEVQEIRGGNANNEVFSSPQEYFSYLEVSIRGSRRLQKKLGREVENEIF